MPKLNIKDVVLAAVLFTITAANIGYRIGASKTRASPTVSEFKVGDVLPKFNLQSVAMTATGEATAKRIAAGACHIIVLFSATCAHCHDAARRDSANTDTTRLPVMWVGVQNKEGLGAFASIITDRAPVYYSLDALALMQAKGVPAAFLVDKQNRVRSVMVYQGIEDHSALRKQCTAST